MRKELTINEMEDIKNNEWLIFSTVDDNSQPHSIIVLPSRIEKNRIILSNIQMSHSIQNIKINPKCFINVYLKEQNDKQIKISGIGKVEENGELFNDIKTYEETNNLPEDLKVRSIIVIEICNIEISEE